MRTDKPKCIWRTAQRVNKTSRKRLARKSAKLHTVRVNQPQLLAISQHVEIIEVTDHNTAPMEPTHDAVKLPKHRDHLVAVDT